MLFRSPEESLKSLRDALQQSVTSLEQRYAQPNWFNVAAGFLKPQLGGFAASLGSASQALGENIEQQKAVQLPLAQMRAQLAQADIMMGQNKKVADMEADRIAKGRPVTPEYVREVTALAPGSTVASALSNELKTQQEQQNLLLNRIQIKTAKGLPLTPEERQWLQLKPIEGTPKPGGEEAVPGVKFQISGTPQEKVQKLQAALLAATDPNEMVSIAKELAKIKQEPTTAPTAEPKTATAFYPHTFKMPQIEGLGDQERQALVNAFAANAAGQEKANQDKLVKISALAVGPDYTSTKNNYDTAISMIENNPQLAQQVFNIIRSNGQVAAALNAGFGVHAGSFNANVSLPDRKSTRLNSSHT